MIYKLIDYISLIGYVILFFNTVCFSLTKIKERPYLILTIYLFFIISIEILGNYYQNEKNGNLFLTHYYFIIQSIFLSIFYYLIINNTFLKKTIKIVLPATLFSLAIQYYFYPELYHVFNVFEIFICIIPLVVYSLVHLFQTLGGNNKKYIYITSGVLIYFLPHALVFSSGNLMPNLPKKTNQIIWLVNVLLYVVFLLLITVEWYKNFRRKDSN